MHNKNKSFLAIFALLLAFGTVAQPKKVYLDELDLTKITQGWGDANPNKTVMRQPIIVANKTFERGVGTHGTSIFKIKLDGKAIRLYTQYGFSDKVAIIPADHPVVFEIFLDGKKYAKSDTIYAKSKYLGTFDIPLKGVKELMLKGIAIGGTHHSHINWCDGYITYQGKKPESFIREEKPYILTPKPSGKPSINTPSVYGFRPNNPVLYKLPISGNRPMEIIVSNLPIGLTYDIDRNVIVGKVNQKGTYEITISAKNDLGKSDKKLKLICGDKIQLTPAMGWNSWNAYGMTVDEVKVRRAAKAFVEKGLDQYGWSFINIDDGWQGFRGVDSVIVPNKKFSDMKKLGDDIHQMGLKFGIYTGPGPKTCGGLIASYANEETDVETYCKWGVDYIKYDHCQYSKIAKFDEEAGKIPYRYMGHILKHAPRDIVYSLCQYGGIKVWEWGHKVNGNSWRTTGDITDTWSSVYDIYMAQLKISKYTQIGHFNDPDMLVLGHLGWNYKLHPTKLTPSEQYSHVTIWCMLASPLLLGCDLDKLDDFTMSLITNPEVIAINQDARCAPIEVVKNTPTLLIFKRLLEDGSYAIAIINNGETEQTLNLTTKDLGIDNPKKLRDLWRQSDVANITKPLKIALPIHGCQFYKAQF